MGTLATFAAKWRWHLIASNVWPVKSSVKSFMSAATSKKSNATNVAFGESGCRMKIIAIKLTDSGAVR
jgi:hypothetical protein